MRTLKVCLLALLFAGVSSASAQQPEYAGNASCLDCHDKESADFRHGPKGQVLMEYPRTAIERLGCEGCHGPGKQHAESGGEELGALIIYGPSSKTPVTEQNASCLQCHDRTARTLWQGSAHEAGDVACTDCHEVMHAVSESSQLRQETVVATCGRCHQRRVAQLQRSSHMPLGERKMECNSCHNPHGSPNPRMLHAASTNETCYTCHAEKRGPYLWEHPPVVEDCANCHDSHGSSQAKMLKVSRPRLCQQCHAGTSGHPNSPKVYPDNVQHLFNRQCSNCHAQIHGSNHPSGSRFTR